MLSVGIDGATVTQVAQRYEITRQQIYAWRYELKMKGMLPPDAATLFLPIDVPPLPTASGDVCPFDNATTRIEVVLRNRRSLRVATHVDAAALTRLIRAVEAA